MSYGNESLNDNVIGGVSASSRNVISGNTTTGVFMSTNGTGNRVIGNYIGTDATGAAALPNGIGVHLQSGNGTLVGGTQNGAGNVISGNTSHGVYVQGPDSTQVLGNLIGTNAAGNADLGNGGAGIQIDDGLNTVVGNNTAAGRNVVSGNTSYGVRVEGGVNSNGTSIRRNIIGSDSAGTLDIGNGSVGISTGLSISNVTIQNNLASGNELGYGIATGSGGGNFTIVGNRVGTDVAGTQPLPNLGGMYIQTPNSTVGGPSAQANTVAFNDADGVVVHATGIQMRSNSIHSNGALGVDLGGDGVTGNDVGDGDAGANNSQNFPELTSAVSGSLTVGFTLDSAASTQFRIQFFANDTCDPSGNGEGQTLIGSTVITTDASGDFAGAVATSATIAPGKQITATATNLTTLDTSEFSACIAVQPAVTPTPSPTPIGQTPTPTPTPSPIGQTPTPTPTASPTPIPLETDPPTPVPTPTPTPTPTPILTPTPTVTPTPTATPIGQTPSPSPTPTPVGQTPSPTPVGQTPTPTPTPTATPTSGAELAQGNVDCDSDTDSVDALKVLRFVALLTVSQGPDCPQIGTEVASLFGDVDCNGGVTSVDALKILRFVAALSVAQTEPCPDIGQPLS
jgi:hypothetical protein